MYKVQIWVDIGLDQMTYVNQSDASFQNHCSHAAPRRVHK